MNHFMGTTTAETAVARRAFSLTELLVAMTISLAVMGAVATLFGTFGRSVTNSQAIVDISSRMRSANWQLRKDLSGVTCDVVPWLAPEADAGYFEYIEGTRKDWDAQHGTPNLEADTDDVLLFTTQAIGEPFVCSTTGSNTCEADRAEVAWFCRPAASQPVAGLTLHNLYRRQFLVSAAPGAGAFSATARISGTNAGPWSIRTVSGNSYPNSLGDLTKREHRFLHAAGFPHVFQGANAVGATLDGTDQEGEDVVLSNVIAFDVRAFDPQASDYIDLGVGGVGVLAGAPSTKSGLTTPTYDTWSVHYEFANPPTGGFNDAAQYTRGPPYPVPLRGIEVQIRCYEPTSKQVRQITVLHSFRRDR